MGRPIYISSYGNSDYNKKPMDYKFTITDLTYRWAHRSGGQPVCIPTIEASPVVGIPPSGRTFLQRTIFFRKTG